MTTLASIDREWMVLIGLGALYFAWVMLPAVPAILIYRLFPNTTVAVSGPLAGLTVKAGGAFAAYLIIFAATYEPLIPPTRDIIASWQRQFWTINGDIKLVRADGSDQPYSESLFSKLRVVKPVIKMFDSNQATLKMEDHDGQWPVIVIEIPNFGEKAIPLKSMGSKIEINRFRKTINIKEPIIIQEASSGGAVGPISSTQPRSNISSTESQ